MWKYTIISYEYISIKVCLCNWINLKWNGFLHSVVLYKRSLKWNGIVHLWLSVAPVISWVYVLNTASVMILSLLYRCMLVVSVLTWLGIEWANQDLYKDVDWWESAKMFIAVFGVL